MPQDVVRDTSDNILPHLTVKTISYLWQGATCIHLLGEAQARQYEPNTMAVCSSCNEALLFVAPVSLNNYYKLQTETRNHLFSPIYMEKCGYLSVDFI